MPKTHPQAKISIHAPREGSDLGLYHLFGDGELFQSTLPVRGATVPVQPVFRGTFISIHAPREGSDPSSGDEIATHTAISIHAPREGSDLLAFCRFPASVLISIHAPREGSDGHGRHALGIAQQFQSTLPVRGATRGMGRRVSKFSYFNPRSP